MLDLVSYLLGRQAAKALPALELPASGEEILAGYEAYDANGDLITGTYAGESLVAVPGNTAPFFDGSIYFAISRNQDGTEFYCDAWTIDIASRNHGTWTADGASVQYTASGVLAGMLYGKFGG